MTIMRWESQRQTMKCNHSSSSHPRSDRNRNPLRCSLITAGEVWWKCRGCAMGPWAAGKVASENSHPHSIPFMFPPVRPRPHSHTRVGSCPPPFTPEGSSMPLLGKVHKSALETCRRTLVIVQSSSAQLNYKEKKTTAHSVVFVVRCLKVRAA